MCMCRVRKVKWVKTALLILGAATVTRRDNPLVTSRCCHSCQLSPVTGDHTRGICVEIKIVSVDWNEKLDIRTETKNVEELMTDCGKSIKVSSISEL